MRVKAEAIRLLLSIPIRLLLGDLPAMGSEIGDDVDFDVLAIERFS